MTPELQILLGSIVGGTGALLSYWAGWRARGAQMPPMGSYGRCLDPDWRRSFNHENINRPSGPPPLNLRRSEPVRMDKGRTMRGNGNSGPTTPKPPIKPQFPPPRQIREDFLPLPAPERWATVTVQGLNWPATLGDFTLVGPVNNQGAWRWYERRHHDGSIERIKVDHQLQPLKPMSTDLSITPPLELATSLRNSAPHGIRDAGVTRELWLINHAYTAGADQELEACREWLNKQRWEALAIHLRAARRPKPPTLKEQAQVELDRLVALISTEGALAMAKPIRRALEALDD